MRGYPFENRPNISIYAQIHSGNKIDTFQKALSGTKGSFPPVAPKNPSFPVPSNCDLFPFKTASKQRVFGKTGWMKARLLGTMKADSGEHSMAKTYPFSSKNRASDPRIKVSGEDVRFQNQISQVDMQNSDNGEVQRSPPAPKRIPVIVEIRKEGQALGT